MQQACSKVLINVQAVQIHWQRGSLLLALSHPTQRGLLFRFSKEHEWHCHIAGARKGWILYDGRIVASTLLSKSIRTSFTTPKANGSN
jgi:hypothetical protein